MGRTTDPVKRFHTNAIVSVLACVLVAAGLVGCERPERFSQEYTPWLWVAHPIGKVRASNTAVAGDNLRFGSGLDMDDFVASIGVDGVIEIDRRLITFSALAVEMTGRKRFLSPMKFEDLTFAEFGPETVRTDYDLLLWRIGYGNAFGTPGERMFALEGAMQVIDFNINLRGSTGISDSLDGTIPVLVVGMRVDCRLTESLVLRAQLFGLSYPRVFGIKNDFFRIRGDFVTWRLNLLWGSREDVRLLAGWSSVLMDLDNGRGDRIKTELHGLMAGLQLRF